MKGTTLFKGALAGLAACATMLAAPAHAWSLTYGTEALFVASAGGARVALPATLAATPSFLSGAFTFTAAAGQTFVIDPARFGTAVPGGPNLNINGYESYTVRSAVPLHAFGFYVYQPSNAYAPLGSGRTSCSANCDRGTFTLSFEDATGAVLASYSLPVTSSAPQFFGFGSSYAFTTIRIWDDLHTVDNEYFGGFRFGTGLPRPVPAGFAAMDGSALDDLELFATAPVPELPAPALALGGLMLLAGLCGRAGRRRGTGRV